MFDTEEKVITIDASEDTDQLGAITLDDKYEDQLKEKKFDVVRLKTELCTKEYDRKRKLIAVQPFFMDVRVAPVKAKLKILSSYTLENGAKVEILENPDSAGYIYAIQLPETNITFTELATIKDDTEEFERTGKTSNQYIKRWIMGEGILEYLLLDKKVLEVNINPPGYKTAMRIVHADFDECVSNIYPSDDFLNALATRLKISTGRPFNKAQPQLDGEIVVKATKARVAALVSPFSVFGTAYSIRKHREDPWTLPLFLKNQMINEWFVGIMSFAITHGRTFLTAGPRGSGKTSLLGSLLLEILPKYRIISIEDTQELPVNAYKELGYDILPLKVRSALLDEGMEMPFDRGLRTSLRLGDSCLIIGEIRSKEAKILYEAMRVGAMSNVVAGTIHGDSPYGVFDRVVNDLGVTRGSFKVTDLVIIVNQIKSASGLSRKRRVLSVTEVLKDWDHEPKFQDLLVYNPKTDTLEPTEYLLKGKSVVLNQVLSRTQGYKNYKDMLKDIQLRGWAKVQQVKHALVPEQLESNYISKCNIIFVRLFEHYKPLSSKQHEEYFKRAFLKEIKDFYAKDLETLEQRKKEKKESTETTVISMKPTVRSQQEEGKEQKGESFIEAIKRFILQKKEGN